MRPWLLVLALLPAPLAALEEPAPPPEQATAAETPPVAGAAWCALKSHKSEPTAVDPEAEEVPAAEPSPEVGCDVGVGFRIWGWLDNRVAAVGTLGTKSVGLGLALVAYRPKRGPVGAVALLAAAPYDAAGIYTDHAAITLGATLSFLRRQP